MLDSTEVADVATILWRQHAKEMPDLDLVRGYMRGERGRPTLPEDPDDEIKELAKLAVRNVMPLVVDAFASALTVSGFRSPSSEVDAPVWGLWQRERMDARQAEVHRPAIQYGASYLLLDQPDGRVRFNPRSPRRMFAAYDDPTRDEWPQYALETWVEVDGRKRIRHGILRDADAEYHVTIPGSAQSATATFVANPDDGPPSVREHPFGVCPVVRFVNVRDVEDMLGGEVEPLIVDQKTLDAINFDRLVVSRFGAFPPKVVMGWAPQTGAEASRLSARRIITFEDPDVKIGSWPAANVDGYNGLIEEQLAYIATKARIQVHALTGKISNVGTETVALIDSPNQRKMGAKRLSFGESWEQALRKGAEVEGTEVPEDAEVVWDVTEAQSFAQIVDGIGKLVTAGVPIDGLVDKIPGLSQQEKDGIRESIRKADATGLAAKIIQAARTPQQVAAVEPAAEQEALF